MPDQFDSASPGVRINNYEGQLLLLKPTELRENINTKIGQADAVVVEMTILDGDEASTTHTDVLVFGKALQGQLRGKIGTGRMVLGRLGKGIAKPGMDAPWVLQEPTEADKKLARSFLSINAEPPF